MVRIKVWLYSLFRPNMLISWQYPYLFIKIHFLRNSVWGLIPFTDQVFAYNMYESLEQQCASCVRIQLPSPSTWKTSISLYPIPSPPEIHLPPPEIHLPPPDIHLPPPRKIWVNRYLYYSVAATFSWKSNWQNDSLMLFIINMFWYDE